MQFPYTLIWFLNTSIRSWILLYDLEYFFLEHFSVITKQYSWWHTFFHSNALALYNLMVKTGYNQCMGLLKRWLKTSERPWKVHSKWNSTVNRDLNVEPVTTADGWFKTSERLWNVHSKWYTEPRSVTTADSPVFWRFIQSLTTLLLSLCRHSWYCVPLIVIVFHS